MKKSLKTRCVFLLILCGGFLFTGDVFGFEYPEANVIRNNSTVTVSSAIDIKKQKLPVPSKLSAQKFFPNLENLITQFQRFSELMLMSQKIAPRIYLNTTEAMVADFEAAITQLEIADANLQIAMYEAFVNNNPLGMSPNIKNAANNLDVAEFTLKLLLEIVDAEL